MVDNQLDGNIKRSLDPSRRNTQDRNNLQQFFAMGIVARYPDIDDYSINKAVEHPTLLLQEGFLESIEGIHLSLRGDLTDAIVSCIEPQKDLATAVRQLNLALQSQRSICRILVDSNSKEEKLLPLQLERLLGHLDSLSDIQIGEYLSHGLLKALKGREQRNQQRTHQDIDLKRVQEIVDTLITDKTKASFDVFELISKDFEMKE